MRALCFCWQGAAIHPATGHQHFARHLRNAAFIVVDEGDEGLHGGPADFARVLINGRIRATVRHAECGQADVLRHAILQFRQPDPEGADIRENGVGFFLGQPGSQGLPC